MNAVAHDLDADLTVGVDMPHMLTSCEVQEPKQRCTPLPKAQIAVLVMILLTESLTVMMLFPFVGLFVGHLMGWSPEVSGYLSGVLVGLFMLGQVLSSKVWGHLSDTYGRKQPLIIGLLVGATMMFVFGISPNIYVACAARFVHGFFNGTIMTAKTVVADITDKTNEAKGFALVSLAWGVGALVGPTFGGFLYDPVHNPKMQWLHASEGGFFDHNPAFLPGLVISVYMICAWTVTLLFLKETHPSPKPLWHVFPCLRPTLPTSTSSEGLSKTSEPFTSFHDDDYHSTPEPTPGALVPLTAYEEKGSKLTYMDAARIPSSRYLILLFMLFSASEMAYSEVLPLWAIASTDVGGLGIFSDEVAILILAGGVPLLVANLFFHYLCSVFTDKMLFWRIAVTIYSIATCLAPCGSLFDNRNSRFWFTLSMGVIRQFGIAWCYSLCSLLIPKVAPPMHVGTMFGVQQAAGAFTRCVIPFAAAPLFAWSISSTKHHFPYDHFLLFIISTLFSFSTFFLSFFLHVPADRPTNVANTEPVKERLEVVEGAEDHL